MGFTVRVTVRWGWLLLRVAVDDVVMLAVGDPVRLGWVLGGSVESVAVRDVDDLRGVESRVICPYMGIRRRIESWDCLVLIYVYSNPNIRGLRVVGLPRPNIRV